MGTININPNSESELIDLIDAKELIIENIEEISNNQQLIEHQITFIFKDKSKTPPINILQQKTPYDNISNYSQFKIKNNNPKNSIKITYTINSKKNPDDYKLQYPFQ